ncbi:MAG: hypothetical protein SwStaBPW_28550 [Shewanella algae]
MKNLKFKSSTIGLMASHKNLPTCKLIRVEFYEKDDESILLKAVSGHSLGNINSIKSITIPRSEYADRPYDYYDSSVEASWAFGKLGLEI